MTVTSHGSMVRWSGRCPGLLSLRTHAAEGRPQDVQWVRQEPRRLAERPPANLIRRQEHLLQFRDLDLRGEEHVHGYPGGEEGQGDRDLQRIHEDDEEDGERRPNKGTTIFPRSS